MLSQEIVHAFRSLLRARGFSLLVVTTLGLGIGANTAIFSMVDAALLRRLPYGNGLAACLVPARRALGTEPARAMRAS